MYATILLDKRVSIYNNLCKLAENPKTVLELLEKIADRTEGKPTQRIEAQVSRTTVFGPDERVVEPLSEGQVELDASHSSSKDASKNELDRVIDRALVSRTLAGLDVEEA